MWSIAAVELADVRRSSGAGERRKLRQTWYVCVDVFWREWAVIRENSVATSQAFYTAGQF
jgi:hypothetical protein